MVILAAISINAVYQSKIVNYAINGTQDYVREGINENQVLEGTEKLIESVVNSIDKILGGKPTESKPEDSTQTEKTKEELSQDKMIGKYVDYKPQGTDYTVAGEYSGTGANQTFAKNDNMKWRIWGVEGDKLLLISETLGSDMTLKGADGYNNAVKLLNDACSTAFGNPSYGSVIKVRSINQDDIDKVTNMTTEEARKAVNSHYGEVFTPGSKKCPNIYVQETGGGSLDRSSQDSWITGTTESDLSVKTTLYPVSISSHVTHTIYDALLTNPVANSTNGKNEELAYWVASRFVWCWKAYSNLMCFNVGLMFVAEDEEKVSDALLLSVLTNSFGESQELSVPTRPMVEIDLNAVSIGVTGSGTDTNPYSIVKK